MIDKLVHDAVTVFIWLLVFNGLFLITVIGSAVKRPQHYKLKGKK